MSESKVAPIAAKLRASVLQQAVEGKLVPQNPDDEPSSVLLERIREERAELVKQKKAKAPRGGESQIYRGADGSWYEQHGKAEPVCIDKEIPFDVPENWEWSRLGNITEYIQRGKSPKYSTIEKYPVVAQKCNQWSGFSLAKAKFIDPSTLSQYGIERFLITGDLLWNSTGLGTLGRIAIYDDTVNPYECAVADSHVTVIRTDARWMNYSFLFAYFAGPSVQRIIESQASGSTKQKELSLATVQNYLVPVPPLAEQQRIVERINEIMPLIDRLEKLERERCCRFPFLAGSAELDPSAGRRRQTRSARPGRRAVKRPAGAHPKGARRAGQAEESEGAEGRRVADLPRSGWLLVRAARQSRARLY